MAVLRGGGVPGGEHADRADVKSANNGELRVTLVSLPVYREAKKLCAANVASSLCDRKNAESNEKRPNVKDMITHCLVRVIIYLRGR
jgi:hypothetical protein